MRSTGGGTSPARLTSWQAYWCSHHPIRLTFILWTIYFVGICIAVALQPKERTVTDVYRTAVGNYWSSKPLYLMDTLHGFLYMPHTAVSFTPVTWPPFLLGEWLWRLVGMAALLRGVYLLWSRFVIPEAPRREGQDLAATGHIRDAYRWSFWLVLMSVVVFVTAAGSSKTGQVNSLMGGLMIMAAVDLVDGKNWRAALWLGVTFAFKPTVLPMMMIAGAIVPRARLPMLVALLAPPALAWLNPDWSYVASTHEAWFVKMTGPAVPNEGWFSDVAGLINPIADFFRVEVPRVAYSLFRVLTAGLALVGAFWAGRQLGLRRAGFVMLSLSVIWIMLCNPRTEGNTYAIMAPIAGAIWAMLAMYRRTWWVVVVGLACLGLMISRELTLGETNFWIRPLATIICLAALGALCWQWTRGTADERRGEQDTRHLTWEGPVYGGSRVSEVRL